MAWRTVTWCSRNVWVTNTSESQNSVPVLPHGLGHTSELRGCNACPSPYLVPPLKKNSCYCGCHASRLSLLCAQRTTSTMAMPGTAHLSSPSLPETSTRIFSRWVAFLHPHSYAQKERTVQGMSNSNLKGKA